MRHLQDLIERVNDKLFNDKMYARNLNFEQKRKLHDDLEWTDKWAYYHPIDAGEIDWHNHSIASEQALFKDLGTDPNAYKEYR